MAQPPVLETRRLWLVPFADEHLTARYVGWLNDPEVVRYSELRHRAHTVESCQEYFRSFVGSPHYYWAITVRDTGSEHIGNITAHVDPPNRVADIGILIGDKRTWGRGYGTEAWCTVCAWLLESAGLRKLTAGAMASNEGMVSVMQRAGMIEEGRRRRQFLLEGRPMDLVYYALFREGPDLGS